MLGHTLIPVLLQFLLGDVGRGPVGVGPPPGAGGGGVRDEREDEGGAGGAPVARTGERGQREGAGVRVQHGRVDVGV